MERVSINFNSDPNSSGVTNLLPMGFSIKSSVRKIKKTPVEKEGAGAKISPSLSRKKHLSPTQYKAKGARSSTVRISVRSSSEFKSIDLSLGNASVRFCSIVWRG